MSGFTFATPDRTILERGARARAAEEIAAFGRRVLLVRGCSVPWVDELVADLQTRGQSVETVISRGEPTLEAVRAGMTLGAEFGATCVVAVGGGAVIDLGKALSGLVPSGGDPADFLEIGNDTPRTLAQPLPFVAIPTTSGTGAEATKNAVIGVPDRQQKISLRDARLLPDLALIDPALTDGAPKALTLASGMDAVTQLVESYLCTRSNPLTDAICRGLILDAIAALVRLMETEDPAARDTMARASFLSGLTLANSGLGIVHGLAAIIGGRGGAHGAICGRLLPAALTVNRTLAKAQRRDIARFDDVNGWIAAALGAETLTAFIDRHGLPQLADLNCPETITEDIATRALGASSTKANPADLTPEDVREILTMTHAGLPSGA